MIEERWTKIVIEVLEDLEQMRQHWRREHH